MAVPMQPPCPHGLDRQVCEICQSVHRGRFRASKPPEASVGQIASMESAIPVISQKQMADFFMQVLAQRGEPFMKAVMEDCGNRYRSRIPGKDRYCECYKRQGYPDRNCEVCHGTGEVG